ncbi:hypothetical protein [Streptomyces minutiscleroticus]|uniref:hypothetical protein n=1 Tax=Streptomyces minutiscleroticus TaxID=68238 RepID=UPI00332B0375
MLELERITARRNELDTLAEESAKQLAEVQAEREELVIAERVLHRLAEQDRAVAEAAAAVAPRQPGWRHGRFCWSRTAAEGSGCRRRGVADPVQPATRRRSRCTRASPCGHGAGGAAPHAVGRGPFRTRLREHLGTPPGPLTFGVVEQAADANPAESDGLDCKERLPGPRARAGGTSRPRRSPR